MRAIPFHAARGKTFLPADLLAAEGLTTNDALSRRHGADVKRVDCQAGRNREAHFEQARQVRIPKQILPAILPAAIVQRLLAPRDPATATIRCRTETTYPSSAANPFFSALRCLAVCLAFLPAMPRLSHVRVEL